MYMPVIPYSIVLLLLKYTNRKCGLKDPSWTEIHNFVVFLDFQLKCCENSVFCDVQFVGDVMSSRKRPVRSSMKEFIVKFMISLSRVSLYSILSSEYKLGMLYLCTCVHLGHSNTFANWRR